jgi:hypothetical protein
MHPRLHLLPDIEKHILDDEEAILSVIHDVGEFVRMLTHAQSVHNGARRGDPEVGFQMFMPIPQ